MKHVYLNQRFYYALAAVIGVFLFSFGMAFLFPVAQILLGLLVALVLVDGILLFRIKNPVEVQRIIPEVFALAEKNQVQLKVVSRYPFAIQASIYDELPFQLQERDFEIIEKLESGFPLVLTYELFPDERGVYAFGHVNVFASGPIGLIKRRLIVGKPEEGKVYPSIPLMKKMELLAMSKISTLEGVKKLRRIGHNYEFEQIKSYVIGDDIRSINWKATGKRHQIMVNQYQDERAQQVYLVIDKSRSMELRFKQVRYIDYAINSALVMANIALKKYDKAGLVTFSDRIGASIKAERSRLQLRRILEQLYREKPSEKEANYDLLMRIARKMFYGRSLVLLYTNFESDYALERMIPYLRKLNRMHLLVVIFFEDAEIAQYAMQQQVQVPSIYQQVLAGTYLTNKRKMKSKLQKLGIQTILTTPEKLSVDTLNKYLELKARGLI